jgi:glycerophosphoryl diester phosphodiesterase
MNVKFPYVKFQVAVCLVLLSISCKPTDSSSSGDLHRLNIDNIEDLQDYFTYTGNDIPLISGHRGGAGTGYPENCIETFEHVLRHTPATFEIDPRLTKDSVIVLMHDATLDRTTNGTGKLSDHTWEEVKKLRLKDSRGNITNFRVPSLDEVIKWSKGKTVVILDKKDVPLAMTARKIREHNAEAHVMITVHTAEQAKFYYEDNPRVMFEAFVKTKDALFAYEEAGIPWKQVMAYVGPEMKSDNKELYDLLHERGVMCMISAAPIYDKLSATERAGAYREILKSGVDIIESDRPIQVAEAIRPLIPESSPKEKYFN